MSFPPSPYPPPSDNDPDWIHPPGKVILVVEAETVVLGILVKLLEIDGHRVLAARTLEEAVSIERSLEGDLALLIVGLILEEGKGSDLARRLRRARPSLKVVYMSGQDLPGPEDLLSGDGFLLKPIGFEALRKAVR